MTIIHVYPENDDTNTSYSFSNALNIIDLTYKTDEFLSESSQELSIQDFLLKNKISLDQAEGILISEDCDWKHAIFMIILLKLNRELPILWASDHSYNEIALKCNNPEFGVNKLILPCNSFRFIDVQSYNKVNEEIEDYFIQHDSTKDNTNPLAAIKIFNPPRGSHQLTNEWGAYKLAYTAGYYDLLEPLKQLQPSLNLIYFQYLIQKHGLIPNNVNQGENTNPIRLEGKVLYIDDNYEKGWAMVLKRILETKVNLELRCYESVINFAQKEEQCVQEIVEIINTEAPQLILLDLRLIPEDDLPVKNYTNIEDFTGGRILNTIKAKFPFLPVIIFTASNKAWNMSQLFDEGADGYFIKESPTLYPDEALGNENFQSFLKLLT